MINISPQPWQSDHLHIHFFLTKQWKGATEVAFAFYNQRSRFTPSGPGFDSIQVMEISSYVRTTKSLVDGITKYN